MLGVDPVSGNVYVGDMTAKNTTVKEGNRENWRHWLDKEHPGDTDQPEQTDRGVRQGERRRRQRQHQWRPQHIEYREDQQAEDRALVQHRLFK